MMKRRIFALLGALLILGAALLPATLAEAAGADATEAAWDAATLASQEAPAESQEEPAEAPEAEAQEAAEDPAGEITRFEPGSYNLVVDEAGLMSVEMLAALDSKAWQISQANNLEVVVLVVAGTGGKDIMTFSEDFWDENGYGYGYNHDGVMMTIDLDGRDWCIDADGDGNRIYTDYGKEVMSQQIVPYLSNGQYYEAFDRFLDLAGSFAVEANTQQPYDVFNEYNGEPETLPQKLGKAAPIGLIASALTTLFGMGGMKRGMNTVQKKHGAIQYARRDSMRMDRQADIFLYRTQRRERLPDPPRGGGGGHHGGTTTHVSSHGHTHSSAHGKF